VTDDDVRLQVLYRWTDFNAAQVEEIVAGEGAQRPAYMSATIFPSGQMTECVSRVWRFW
jgi:hypothetical protein